MPCLADRDLIGGVVGGAARVSVVDSAWFLRHLRGELDTFRDCLGGDLSVRIEHCGEWTLYDLADHLGGSNLWAAVAVTEQRVRFQNAALQS
jgi:hypothetical protein